MDEAGTVYVRIVSLPLSSGLEKAINRVLADEQRAGSEVVDVKVSSIAGSSSLGVAMGGQQSATDHVAVILLRKAS